MSFCFGAEAVDKSPQGTQIFNGQSTGQAFYQFPISGKIGTQLALLLSTQVTLSYRRKRTVTKEKTCRSDLKN